VSAVSAAIIGLLPAPLVGRSESIGNASGLGAVGLLSEEGRGERLDALAERCVIVDPSASPGFDSHIAGELRFPAPDAVLEGISPESTPV
jgi:uncharacterized 2Fe-2S/4Fe-4S cluster protein (DUF4445 family)